MRCARCHRFDRDVGLPFASVPNERLSALLAYAPPLNRELMGPEQRARLARLCDLVAPDAAADFDDERIAAELSRVEVVISGWGCPKLDEATLDRMPVLRAVFHAAGTVKSHVTPACFDRGIRVTSAALANAIPVAEYTVAAILFGNKRAFRAQRRYAELRAFRLWSEELPGLGNHRKVVGIVGASHVGRLVIEHLAAFDLSCLVFDPYLDDAEAEHLGARRCELDELMKRSDVVSLHAPLLRETRGMIDARRLALMRDGTVLINTARGAIVDQDALTRELVSGRLDAVIDTTDPEVLPTDSPLYELENVFLTPHIAGSLGDETQRLFDSALDELDRFARGAKLEHEVRREDWHRIA